jgi:hypothetical protein
MKMIKAAILATTALVAAASPMTLNNETSGLFRLEVSCASAQTAIDEFAEAEGGNSGCEPATGYVCTTPRADYLDKRPI